MQLQLRGPQLFFLLLWLLAGACSPDPLTVEGVSTQLAQHRKLQLSEVEYHLFLKLPEQAADPVVGKVEISFQLLKSGPIIIDFKAKKEDVHRVKINGKEGVFELKNHHIILPSSGFSLGQNFVEIYFTAGQEALNRQPDFMYTLFVPDRASTAFPCFDQPNIKARVQLTLETPQTWQAVANGVLLNRDNNSVPGRCIWGFGMTPPIPTYLVAFAAGKFYQLRQEIDGQVYTMYHRENDSLKVAANSAEIFALHHRALNWMKEYSEIDYPYGKLDFVLVPSFQYGGMEHPGAILYNAQSLMLEANASPVQHMSRASLISHEVAHMWFGNLVTMDWFDDVWLKEVFANFMAAKMVHPSFPDINHDLRFLLSHYPAAMAIDRSLGTHPIQQPLDNLQYAGTLYGPIIYQKAPIMMRQLELHIGEEAFQAGIKDYLKEKSFGNATWDDLVEYWQRHTTEKLQSWSNQWVKKEGRPTVFTWSLPAKKGREKEYKVVQTAGGAKDDIWIQNFSMRFVGEDTMVDVQIPLKSQNFTIDPANIPSKVRAIIPNANGLGYGYFSIGNDTRNYLLKEIAQLDPLARGMGWLLLYEDFLDGKNNASTLMDAMLEGLVHETEPQLVDYLVGRVETLFWKFLSPSQREALAPQLEGVFITLLTRQDGTSLKSMYFKGFRTIAFTEKAIELLKKAYYEEIDWQDFSLSLDDKGKVAMELAVREAVGWEAILEDYFLQLDNNDKRQQWTFIRPALSANLAERDAFFDKLKEPTHREREAWVLEALRYLHHPLRADHSVKYLRPSLELMMELQATGDIFFSKRWIDATLSGHQSTEAADVVRQFLYSNQRYPRALKNQILQASDLLFRAEKTW